jgi:hypothetical protein
VASLFFSYSRVDEGLRDELETQLAMLRRQGIIEVWHDRRIDAGEDFAKEIDHHVETDDIFLLLVSANFLASDYCYEREMKRAMERHEAGEAIVIPVILRPCDWHSAPFGKLNATPPSGRPVTMYPDRDEALLEVAKSVRSAAEKLNKGRTVVVDRPLTRREPTPAASVRGPRSSNLRLAKQFSQRDRDHFKLDTFEYMAKYFENSLSELSARNPGIETSFRRIDANRFTATVYRDGQAAARCTVFIGGFASGGVAYVTSETTDSNTYNEYLSVDSDDQSLFLRSSGMALGQQEDARKLTQEGASEFYWSLLIGGLQRR